VNRLREENEELLKAITEQEDRKQMLGKTFSKVLSI
jgi:hypothetical protein